MDNRQNNQNTKERVDFTMENSALFVICTAIVLVVSALTSIVTMVTLLKNSGKKIKDRYNSELRDTIVATLKAELPEMLKEHDKAIRDRYKADKERYLNEIQDSVLSATKDELNQIKILGIQYESLAISARDVLREKIINIYTEYREARKLPLLKKEKLDQFYKDYKALNGNSYIDKYYRRMCAWSIIDDEYDDGDVV